MARYVRVLKLRGAHRSDNTHTHAVVLIAADRVGGLKAIVVVVEVWLRLDLLCL